MMEFKDLVRQRYSCRKYEDRKVPEETIGELVQIVRYAVSAGNTQPWKIKIVSDPAMLAEVSDAAYGQPQVRHCSHLFVLCADTDANALADSQDRSLRAAGWPDDKRTEWVEGTRNHVAKFDAQGALSWASCQVYAAMTNCVNGAFSLGLGSCPMTYFKPEEVSRVLDLPANVTPVVLVSVGYAAEEGSPKVRYATEDILA
jgi:nitroreductase / dihydropteridine reductase